MDFPAELREAFEKKEIPERIYTTFLDLYNSYIASLIKAKVDYREHSKIFPTYLRLVKEQIASPYAFEPYHKKITSPFNHEKFGIDLFSPLVDWEKSHLFHRENLQMMEQQIEAGENVILLANHQTEVDPQLLKIILEKHGFKELGEDLIFVAGDRVITDPMAVPVSLGCHLLCIYSKRYVDNPPEKKEEKLLHNQKTMKRMKELLAEGRKTIYVAPSGGRDRPDAEGRVVLSPFDPQSIEMFRLMAIASKRPTHFYPLALKTYTILPPPSMVTKELGEARLPMRDGIQVSFGKEIAMEHFSGSDVGDRHTKRITRGDHIFHIVKKYYDEFQ